MAIHIRFDSAVYVTTYSRVCRFGAADFQYQAFSSLDKHDNDVTEVTENVITTYVHMEWISKLANCQQAHVVIEIYY